MVRTIPKYPIDFDFSKIESGLLKSIGSYRELPNYLYEDIYDHVSYLPSVKKLDGKQVYDGYSGGIFTKENTVKNFIDRRIEGEDLDSILSSYDELDIDREISCVSVAAVYGLQDINVKMDFEDDVYLIPAIHLPVTPLRKSLFGINELGHKNDKRLPSRYADVALCIKSRKKIIFDQNEVKNREIANIVAEESLLFEKCISAIVLGGDIIPKMSLISSYFDHIAFYNNGFWEIDLYDYLDSHPIHCNIPENI